MRVLIAGGAGFLGSHLCDGLLARGDEVTALDNLMTSHPPNLDHLVRSDRFDFVHHDVCEPITVDGALDAVIDLASPASPAEFDKYALEILAAGSTGTTNLLDLAVQHQARFMLGSTSEVYGDPHVHPQPESYWGNVNPVGPRSCYDEAKRFSEALTTAYQRRHGVDARIARIFNTYGPRMRPDDGRVVTNFLVQALTAKPLTIYGDGTQTRSFCYVEDEVRGLVALLDSTITTPVNIGNPGEFTMLELAQLVLEVTGSASPLVHGALPADDPAQRRPDITIAREQLGWEPTIELRDGLERMTAWLRTQL